MNIEERRARLLEPRLARELKTIRAMLAIYCRGHHGGADGADGFCADCRKLADYAANRLMHCPYGAEKPTCVNCPVHCYAPRQREEARVMMRYAGPRMLKSHPILAIRHLIDGKRPAPLKPEAVAKKP
jgi:hypothetical protein